MSKKDDDNPLEEIQKQLRDLMKNKNLQVAFAPFMQSMNPSADDPETEQPNDKGKKPKEVKPETEDPLHTIRSFDRKPKEVRDYLDRFVIKQEQAKRCSRLLCATITIMAAPAASRTTGHKLLNT